MQLTLVTEITNVYVRWKGYSVYYLHEFQASHCKDRNRRNLQCTATLYMI
jgi:hypothetical protein